MENVYLNYVDNYDVDELTKSLEPVFDNLKIFDTIKPRSKVLILPTLTDCVSADVAKTTNPNVICAVVNLLNKNNIQCVVAGSPFGKYNIDYLDKVYLETGLIDAENLSKFELNHDLSTTRIQCESGVKTKSVRLLSLVKEVDAIININKLIFDTKLGYMGSVNNLFNLIPGELKTVTLNRLNTIEDYYNYLLDLYCVLKGKIKLNVTDGIVSLEQDTQRMVSCLGVSTDALALDSAILDMFSVHFGDSIMSVALDRKIINTDKVSRVIKDSSSKFEIEDYNTGELSLSNVIADSAIKSKLYFKSHQERMDINPNKCKGCEVCAKICPSGAITIELDKNNEKYAKIDYNKCIFCNKCHTACPYSVIDIKTPHKYKRLKKEIDKFDA